MKDLTNLKPNELIRLAINDMKSTISQGHNIKMYDWGRDIGKSKCSVCFAGAIMLQNGKTPDKYGSFDILDDINCDVYQALDNIRQGNLDRFCHHLKIENPLIEKLGFPISKLDVYYQKGNEEEFYTYMENIAKLFD